MKLIDLVKQFDLEVLSGESDLEREIRCGYVSDLLSDVIGNAQKGDLWITLQIHINVVAVALMKELSGIILIGNRRPEEATLEKAKAEKMPLLVSPLPAFEMVGRLYKAGIPGQKDA